MIINYIKNFYYYVMNFCQKKKRNAIVISYDNSYINYNNYNNYINSPSIKRNKINKDFQKFNKKEKQKDDLNKSLYYSCYDNFQK